MKRQIMNTQIARMDRKELDFLLINHEYFSDREIQLAAKKMVELNKAKMEEFKELLARINAQRVIIERAKADRSK